MKTVIKLPLILVLFLLMLMSARVSAHEQHEVTGTAKLPRLWYVYRPVPEERRRIGFQGRQKGVYLWRRLYAA